MKFILVVIVISTSYFVRAQNSDAGGSNYKHLRNSREHKLPVINNPELTEDTVVINNQRTHKRTSRRYIIAPSDSFPETNVQGKKTKKNYKNQLN